MGDTIGLLLADQELAIARAISDAFELDLTRRPKKATSRSIADAWSATGQGAAGSGPRW